MKKAQPLEVEEFEEFEFVGAEPSGPMRVSALYNHLSITGPEQFAAKNPLIKKISNPTDKRKAYLFHLLHPALPLVHDLIQLLPKNLRDKYTKIEFDGCHVRIDENYGSINSVVTKQKLFAHWHFTILYKVAPKKWVSVHIYYHHGIYLNTFVSAPDIRAEPVSLLFASKARYLAKDGYEIVMSAIAEMKLEKTRLTDVYDQSVANILKAEHLTCVSRNELDAELAQINATNELLRKYLQDSVKENIINDRYALLMKRVIDLHQLAQLPISATADEDNDEKLEFVDASKAELTGAVPPKARRKTKKVTTIADINELQRRFNDLKGQKSSSVKDELKFEKDLQKLKDDLLVAYICLDDAAEERVKTRLSLIHAMVDKLPRLLDVFIKHVLALNYPAVTQLFTAVEGQIPSNLYSSFLFGAVLHARNHEDDQNAVKLCEFFFEHSDDYRLLLAEMDRMRIAHDARSEMVSVSPFSLLASWDRYDLFSLLVKQTAFKDIGGATIDGKYVSLVEVVANLSNTRDLNRFMTLLLDLNIEIERKYPFFAGLQLQDYELDEYEKTKKFAFDTSKNSKSSSTQSNAGQFFNIVYDDLKDAPYIGSVVTVYSAARYKSPAILDRLAKNSSNIHLIIAFARLTLSGIGDMVVYASKKIGIMSEPSREARINLAQQQFAQAENGVTHIGHAIGSEYPEKHRCMLTLLNQITARIPQLSQNNLSDLINQIQTTSFGYESRQDLFNALVCQRAILLLTSYLDPSVGAHLLILRTFVKMANIYSNPGLSFFNQQERESQRHKQYISAYQFVVYSAFNRSLTTYPEYKEAQSRADLNKISSKDTGVTVALASTSGVLNLKKF